jgi:hypothetical protein
VNESKSSVVVQQTTIKNEPETLQESLLLTEYRQLPDDLKVVAVRFLTALKVGADAA